MAIFRVSHNDKEVNRKINELVGKPFKLKDRWKLGGVGSPRLVISSCSQAIYHLLILDNSVNYCNIELRPEGILLGFRSRLESYVLAVPYYRLSVYKGESEIYSIHDSPHFIKVEAGEKTAHKFFRKLLDLRQEKFPNGGPNPGPV